MATVYTKGALSALLFSAQFSLEGHRHKRTAAAVMSM